MASSQHKKGVRFHEMLGGKKDPFCGQQGGDTTGNGCEDEPLEKVERQVGEGKMKCHTEAVESTQAQ